MKVCIYNEKCLSNIKGSNKYYLIAVQQSLTIYYGNQKSKNPIMSILEVTHKKKKYTFIKSKKKILDLTVLSHKQDIKANGLKRIIKNIFKK